MPVLWTLQSYIFREMGRTFLLTALALTGILGLGGGVLNMIKLGEVTPGQLLRLVGLVVPIAAALTLPIAALFSAAATYGRLSADNEFVACRSGGINLHVLFLPTVVLGLLSASITFVFINFLIPQMARNLNEFIGADIGTLIERRLDRPKGITLGRPYRITADGCVVDKDDPNHIVLQRVAFVEVDGESWVRLGTARQVDLNIEQYEASFRASASMSGVSYYDRKGSAGGQFVEEDYQLLRTTEYHTLVPLEIKFLNLKELLFHWFKPHEWREVRKEIRRLRSSLGRRMIYDDLWDDWRGDLELHLTNNNSNWIIKAQTCARIQADGGMELGEVSVREIRRSRQRTYKAERGVLDVEPGSDLSDCGIRLSLYDVRVSDGEQTFIRGKEKLGPVAVPDEIVQRVTQLSMEELLGGEAALGEMAGGATGASDSGPVAKARARVLEVLAETRFRVVSTISERFAFSASVLVLVILGATLGIVFRGAHVVTAFGISFLPSLLVIITIVMGKQLSHNAATHFVGLVVMWSGIAFVAGLDAWTLTRVLRR